MHAHAVSADAGAACGGSSCDATKSKARPTQSRPPRSGGARRCPTRGGTCVVDDVQWKGGGLPLGASDIATGDALCIRSPASQTGAGRAGVGARAYQKVSHCTSEQGYATHLLPRACHLTVIRFPSPLPPRPLVMARSGTSPETPLVLDARLLQPSRHGAPSGMRSVSADSARSADVRATSEADVLVLQVCGQHIVQRM